MLNVLIRNKTTTISTDLVQQVVIRMKNATPALVITLVMGGRSVSGFSQEVGIGTVTPTAKLHIEVLSGYSNPLFKATVQGSAVPHLVILPSGNVGIGVANPAEALDVSGNIQFSGALMPGGNAGTAGQVLVSQGPGVPPQWQNTSSLPGDNWGSQVAQTSAPIVGDGTSGSPITLQLGTSAGEVLIYDGTSWTIRQAPWDSVCNTAVANMVQKWTGTNLCNSQIYDDGANIGIGTASPTHKLHVAGAVYVQDSLRIDGDFRPGGNSGNAGQVLVSQGPGLPPVWQNLGGGMGMGSCVKNVTPCIDFNGNSGTCSAMSLNDCVNACRMSTYSGFSDWRLPTIEEYFCLYAEGYPWDNAGNVYWTLSIENTMANFPSDDSYHYYFRPSDGYWARGNLTVVQVYCRCVR